MEYQINLSDREVNELMGNNFDSLLEDLESVIMILDDLEIEGDEIVFD